ncbi:uncharacterized protein LOC127957483 [Carassius gibelio]|uniref:uncharacterized protein LOC127957483 n=1 Tax=Carassius gibelio TaxID=101364 RepID=UPI00227785F7|nr:uncharacterized protein LOC127957483 [Carassius gibelio]
MRTGQTKSFLLPELHWIHLLIFFITPITGALTDEDVIKARLGGSASFNFKVTTGMKVILAVWKKCPDQKVFVFSPVYGLEILDNNYAGRISVKSNQDIILDKLQESDFVNYCYELTTFPNGSLQGQNKLEKTTENGAVPIMMISVGCSIGLMVLCAIIIGGVCYKKRKSNTASHPGGPPGSQLSVRMKNKKRPKRLRSQNEEEVENEDLNYMDVN